MAGDSYQISVEAATELMNDSFEVIECSPLKALCSDRTLKQRKREIENAISKLRSTIPIALNEPQLASSKNECGNCARLTESIKGKLVSSNRERKIQLLTLLLVVIPEDMQLFWGFRARNSSGQNIESRECNFRQPTKLKQRWFKQ